VPPLARVPDRPPAARRQALWNRRRHLRNPPHADRPRTVRQDGVTLRSARPIHWLSYPANAGYPVRRGPSAPA